MITTFVAQETLKYDNLRKTRQHHPKQIISLSSSVFKTMYIKIGVAGTWPQRKQKCGVNHKQLCQENKPQN